METLKLGIEGLDDIEQIGAGGSSRVYRAKQVELDRLVALKVLKASDDPEVARRFDRERKAMGRLSLNEGIVPVYSSGITDRGEPYLIMPYYPNGSLQDRIEAGPVPWDEAVAYIASAAETMAAAHEADVVHLDLKPANILLSSNGAPRIADFGIAKLMSDQTASGDTGPAFTPTFTAPETLLGGDASPASDVYGLAATLWALIAGRPPFRAIDGEDNTLMAVVGRVVHQPAADLRQLAPEPICSIIEIAMAKEPSDRYPTAGAFRQALAGAVATVSTTSSDQTTASDQTTTVAPGPAGIAGGAASAGAPAAGSAGGAEQSSLQFEAAVPPRLVPAGTSRAASVADAVDRYSGIIVGLGVAAILLIVVFLGQRLLSTDDTATSDSSIQIVEASEQTPSTALNAQAGAGGADDSLSEPAGPTTTSTTELSTTATSAATISVTTTPTSATTEPSTTTTTEETTSSSEDTTPTTEDTTTTTDTSTSSSETTDTTTSSSSSSSSETTETTDTTVPIPRLAAPKGVTARLIEDRVVISWSPPDEADGLAGFTVLRDSVAINATGPAGIRSVDRDLTPGKTYIYQVRADGPAGGDPRNSLPSAGIEVAIPIEQGVPNADDLGLARP